MASSSLPPVPKSPMTTKRVLLRAAAEANSDDGLIKVPAVSAASDFNACRRESREDCLFSIEDYQIVAAQRASRLLRIQSFPGVCASPCFELVKPLLA